MDANLDELRARIQAALDAHDWSERRASLKAGLGSTTLTNFLRRGGGIDPETCRKIAALFEWDEDGVLVQAGHKSRLTLLSHDPLPELKRLLSIGNVWPPEAQQALLTLAMLTMRAG